MSILRVFPRKTNGTPDDDMVVIGKGPKGLTQEYDSVEISVTFSWDIEAAEKLYDQYSRLGLPVSVGGFALGQRGEEFEPGRYLKKGYTITSRGCSFNCPHCFVPKRDGKTRELEIKDGWIVQDDNLLACSDEHIKAVFEMLKRQPQRAKLTGGLEPHLIKPWHLELMRDAKIDSFFTAYDSPGDFDALVDFGKLAKEYGFTAQNRKARAYVLIGYENDTLEKAEVRMHQTIKAGFMPFAMLYRGPDGSYDQPHMKAFQREWSNMYILGSKIPRR
jgi:hypothetical protein